MKYVFILLTTALLSACQLDQLIESECSDAYTELSQGQCVLIFGDIYGQSVGPAAQCSYNAATCMAYCNKYPTSTRIYHDPSVRTERGTECPAAQVE
jgi:hypothetical protein